MPPSTQNYSCHTVVDVKQLIQQNTQNFVKFYVISTVYFLSWELYRFYSTTCTSVCTSSFLTQQELVARLSPHCTPPLCSSLSLSPWVQSAPLHTALIYTSQIRTTRTSTQYVYFFTQGVQQTFCIFIKSRIYQNCHRVTIDWISILKDCATKCTILSL